MARLILFDIDFTLISSNGAGRLALDRAFLAAFGVPEATAGVSFDGRTDRAISLEIVERYDLGNGDALAAVARANAAYLEEIGPALVERSGRTLPGVEALLAAFDGRPRPGLATGNIRDGAKAKLSHFDLWDRFAAGGFGDHSAVRADLVRDGIESLAGVLGVAADPRDCIVLGDTPLDVEAAHVAGARAIGVATGRYSVEELRAGGADWALPDLSDTAAVLTILAS